MKEKRDKKIDFRMTAEERSYIDDAANKLEIKHSEFIRATIFDYELETKTDTELRKKIVVALGRINGNTNQIAKHINSRNEKNIQELVDKNNFLVSVLLDDLAYILNSKKKAKRK